MFGALAALKTGRLVAFQWERDRLAVTTSDDGGLSWKEPRVIFEPGSSSVIYSAEASTDGEIIWLQVAATRLYAIESFDGGETWKGAAVLDAEIQGHSNLIWSAAGAVASKGVLFSARDIDADIFLTSVRPALEEVYRNTTIRSLDPLMPPLATAFASLRSHDEAYMELEAQGQVDDEAEVLHDATRPLVLYELGDPAANLALTTSTDGYIRIWSN